MKLLFVISLLIFSLTTFAQSKVAIIDTGINLNQLKKYRKKICSNGLLDFTGQNNMHDYYGHGTNILSIISPALDRRSCVLIIKVYKQRLFSWRAYIRALVYLSRRPDVKYINISLSGYDFSTMESVIMRRLLKQKKQIHVSAGNNHLNLDKVCGVYPACHKFHKTYKNFKVIGATDVRASNRGRKNVTHWERGRNLGSPRMSGTSQATALHTKKQILRTKGKK